MRKKRLERYLIISSFIAGVLVIVSLILTIQFNAVVRQSYQMNSLLNLIEDQTEDLIDLDDWFDDIFD